MTPHLLRVAAPDPTWESHVVRVAPMRPRVAPGQYIGVTVGLRKFRAFDRVNLELLFELFPGDGAGDLAAALARVPMFLRLPAGGAALSANSRLAKMLSLLGRVRPDRHERADLSVLRGKRWLVEVADTTRDHTGDLDGTAGYSVVRRVLGRA